MKDIQTGTNPHMFVRQCVCLLSYMYANACMYECLHVCTYVYIVNIAKIAFCKYANMERRCESPASYHQLEKSYSKVADTVSVRSQFRLCDNRTLPTIFPRDLILSLY